MSSLWLLIGTSNGDTVPTVGITAHLRSERELQSLARSNVSSFRIDLLWDEVELKRGQLLMPPRYDHLVDTAARSGIGSLLILCYSNGNYNGGDYPESPEAIRAYSRFCAFVVRHFRGRVRTYEIWNEWNYGIGMGGRPPASGSAYARLLKHAYPGIKKADPSAVVLGGVMGGTGLFDDWLPAACRGGLLRNLDGLSFHPYCFGAPGDGRLPEIGLAERVRQVEDCIGHFANGKLIPLYITEIGWPSGRHAYSSTEFEQAAFLLRSYLTLFRLPRIKGVWWYDLCNDGPNRSDREHNFGLLKEDLKPKPALSAMQTIAWVFSRYGRPIYAMKENKDFKSVRLVANDRSNSCYAFWTLMPNQTKSIRLRSHSRDLPTPIQLVSSRATTKKISWKRESGSDLYEVVVRVTNTPTFVIVGYPTLTTSKSQRSRLIGRRR